MQTNFVGILLLGIFNQNVLHLSALTYGDWQSWLVVATNWNILNLSYNQKSINNSTKDNMLVIQEVALGTRYEKLASIGVLSRVSHG